MPFQEAWQLTPAIQLREGMGVLAPLRLQLRVKVTPGCGRAQICLIRVCLGTQALVRACVESGFA